MQFSGLASRGKCNLLSLSKRIRDETRHIAANIAKLPKLWATKSAPARAARRFAWLADLVVAIVGIHQQRYQTGNLLSQVSRRKPKTRYCSLGILGWGPAPSNTTPRVNTGRQAVRTRSVSTLAPQLANTVPVSTGIPLAMAGIA